MMNVQLMAMMGKRGVLLKLMALDSILMTCGVFVLQDVQEYVITHFYPLRMALNHFRYILQNLSCVHPTI